MNGFLLDTNVISEFEKPTPDQRVVAWSQTIDEELLFLSVLTLGEIRRGIVSVSETRRAYALENWLVNELRPRFVGRILSIDEQTSELWGSLSAKCLKQGHPLPVIDGLIAATAGRHGLTLVTRDVSNVVATGVPIVNPWQF